VELACGAAHQVRQALGSFLPRYIDGLRLDPTDVRTPLGGMQFVPADKQSYLRIQLLLNALAIRYPAIGGSVFLYNSHIVSSSLDMVPTPFPLCRLATVC
jgi:hypothetical protein